MMEAEKNGDKDGKVLYKLMNNAEYGETVEKLRNRINLKLKRNQKDYLKWTWRPSCMLHKIFDSDLVTIRKSKVLVMLSKPAYIGMFILELSKVLLGEAHYNEYD